MKMLTVRDYFGPWGNSPEVNSVIQDNAARLVQAVNYVLIDFQDSGETLRINHQTKSVVSGTSYGGFRPQHCPEGAPNSSHKVGRGVDIYDPDGDLDNWLTDQILEKYGLYREHPSATRGWCHLTNRAPKSMKRSFYP